MVNVSRAATWFTSVMVCIVVSEARAGCVFRQHPLDGGVSFAASVRQGTMSTRFRLSRDATITSLRWWGGPGLVSPQPTAFSILFFADTGNGRPRTSPLWVQPARHLTISPTPNSAWPGQQIFEYTAELRIPRSLRGNTDYYLSIVADSGWGWADSIVRPITPGISWMRLSDSGNWTERTLPRAQLAFELIDNADMDNDGALNDYGCANDKKNGD